MNHLSSALSAMRAATQTLHDALEHSLPIAQERAGPTEYVHYLQDLWGWLQPFEASLWQAPWPAELQAAVRGDKLAWIEADLHTLGWSITAIQQLPRCQTPLPLESLAQRFGVAYVVEGAQLGTKVLAKRLAPQLAPWSPRWLIGYGPDNGRNWRLFRESAERSLATPPLRREAATAAVQTFAALGEWFAARRQERAAGSPAPALAAADDPAPQHPELRPALRL